MLHAVALWLSSTGFGAVEEKEEISTAKNPAVTQTASFSTKSSEESVEDRMHLMLGKGAVLCLLLRCTCYVSVILCEHQVLL